MSALDGAPARRRSAMAQAIELTRFRLAKSATMVEFIAANEDVDAWLRRQPGFMARWITEQDDHVVVDALLWASAPAARSAMRRMMAELAGSPVHGLIDQATVSWAVSTVRHSVVAGLRAQPAPGAPGTAR